MIISASYKTDIPAFYGAWFLNRLRAGYCKMVNPYGRQVYRVSLKPADVDGIVFWTKNIGPFLRHLPVVRGMGFPFIAQHSINGYPRALEASVVDARKAVENAAIVRNQFGSRVLVWRYDTILLSSLTPASFHVDNFASLAEGLRGITDEVVISFAQIYKKTRRNLDAAAANAGFEWMDPAPDEKKRLVAELAPIARANGMQLTICSQRTLLVDGAAEARCVDARRMGDAAGRPLTAKLKGNRKECGCFESRDVGDYDTCPHGCVYCYAVQTRSIALERYRQHDPDSEFLFEPRSERSPGTEWSEGGDEPQFKLFPGQG
ncbi:MAG: DUF1848 domain-containing protein [Bryobacterales bacterium]|nr:DUF1848 domain-containing protein [Bryobacterales bacterium]